MKTSQRLVRHVCLSAFLLGIASPPARAQIVTADSVVVDPKSQNNGTLDHALVFGGPRTIQRPDPRDPSKPFVLNVPTGAGIASNRTGGNVNGLDFFTPFLAGTIRMSITADGRLGVGTITPSRLVELNGSGDVELGLRSKDAGGRLWTLQSSAVEATGPNVPLNGTFQIIDRTAGVSRMQIDPATGLVSVGTLRITGGADLAEPFAMSDDALEPGSVVVIDDEHAGQLKLSSDPYDTRVAGVISGAGGIHPALTLTQTAETEASVPNVALSGRIYVLADASAGPIRPGDLLTTSSTRGYCMRASDPDHSHGAILGKAMGGLASGKGLVLALVTLQ